MEDEPRYFRVLLKGTKPFNVKADRLEMGQDTIQLYAKEDNKDLLVASFPKDSTRGVIATERFMSLE